MKRGVNKNNKYISVLQNVSWCFGLLIWVANVKKSFPTIHQAVNCNSMVSFSYGARIWFLLSRSIRPDSSRIFTSS